MGLDIVVKYEKQSSFTFTFNGKQSEDLLEELDKLLTITELSEYQNPMLNQIYRILQKEL